VNATLFDRLTRTFAGSTSRRDIIRGLASALGLGLTAAASPGGADAKKKKRKKNKPKKNEFGCLDVGKKCNGKNSKCCSGICKGKRPKKGKKDKSKCIAHNVGSCQADQDACSQSDIPCGTAAICFRTTGKASFCAALEAAQCFPCTKDADCQEGCGPDAACIVCAECGLTGNTACAGVESCAFPP
jgi:hypothetical protein